MTVNFKLTPRHELILDFLSNPATIRQVSEHLGANYHTIRKDVQSLHFIGKLVRMDYKYENAEVFQTAWESEDSSKQGFKVKLGSKFYDFNQIPYLVYKTPRPGVFGKRVAQILATLYLKGYFENIDRELDSQALPSQFDLRNQLIEEREQMQHLVNLVDSLLAIKPLWDPKEAKRVYSWFKEEQRPTLLNYVKRS